MLNLRGGVDGGIVDIASISDISFSTTSSKTCMACIACLLYDSSDWRESLIALPSSLSRSPSSCRVVAREYADRNEYKSRLIPGEDISLCLLLSTTPELCVRNSMSAVTAATWPAWAPVLVILWGPFFINCVGGPSEASDLICIPFGPPRKCTGVVCAEVSFTILTW